MRGAWDRRLAPVITAFILVVLSAWYGHVRLTGELQSVSNQRGATMAETTRSRTTLTALSADRDFLVEHPLESQAMATAGFRGPQDRLAVSDAVEALGVAYRLNRLQFSISPEEVVTDRAYLGPDLVLVSTPVRLTADAASEADMDGFLQALPKQFNGVVVVESATLRRLPGASVDGAGRSVVKARLEMRWQTLRAVTNDADITEARR